MQPNTQEQSHAHNFGFKPQSAQNIHYYIGVQANLSELDDIVKRLSSYLNYPFNNVGDCFLSDYCSPLPNTLEQERQVVETFAEYQSLAREDCWGYIGGGSSLGNLQGMWIGRSLYPDAVLVFPESAHCSMYRFSQLLHFKHTKVIKTGPGDHVDLADFARQINPGEQVVLVLTAGTTMTSAYDPIDECTAILKQKGCEFYLHVDAALGGLVVPFQQEDLGQSAPACTFANPEVESMTISAHKILGTPMPANIYLCRQDIIQRFKKQVKNIPYLSDIKDINLYSSRDGFRVLAVMARLQQFDAEQIQRLVQQCLETADYLIAGLHAQGITSVFRNAFGMAVVFPLDTFVAAFSTEAQGELFRKYHLVKNQQYAHLYTMGHVTKAICDEFIEDCRRLRNPVSQPVLEAVA